MVSVDDSACLELLDQMVLQDKRVVSLLVFLLFLFFFFFPHDLRLLLILLSLRSQCAGHQIDFVFFRQKPERLSSSPPSFPSKALSFFLLPSSFLSFFFLHPSRLLEKFAISHPETALIRLLTGIDTLSMMHTVILATPKQIKGKPDSFRPTIDVTCVVLYDADQRNETKEIKSTMQQVSTDQVYAVCLESVLEEAGDLESLIASQDLMQQAERHKTIKGSLSTSSSLTNEQSNLFS